MVKIINRLTGKVYYGANLELVIDGEIGRIELDGEILIEVRPIDSVEELRKHMEDILIILHDT